jgi:hypothetical protein
VTETITLTIPAGERYRSVATLVVGGIGTRRELPYERMDDLQLAVLSVLEAGQEGDVSIVVEPADDGVRVSIGPLRAGSADDAGLGRVLGRLVDEFSADGRDGAEWLTLRLADR